eukprot:12412965-Karenia_brevis.AAC.1
MPLVGCRVDRRSLNGVGKVLSSSKIRALMCFICTCKHVDCSGYDVFDNVANKGRFHYVSLNLLEKPFNEKDEPHDAILYSNFDKLYGHAVRNGRFLNSKDSWEWIRKN